MSYWSLPSGTTIVLMSPFSWLSNMILWGIVSGQVIVGIDRFFGESGTLSVQICEVEL